MWSSMEQGIAGGYHGYVYKFISEITMIYDDMGGIRAASGIVLLR